LDDRHLRDLASSFKNGDLESFRILVESMSRTLMAMAYRYTRDWDWAKDLTQETWIKVHDRIRAYDSERSFVGWVHAIHRNGCLDHIRKAWVRLESTPGPDAMASLAGSIGGSAEAEMERREFHERVMAAAAARLSETQRQVFLRVDVEQNDQKEVAKAMGIRFGTLRTTLHFARKRMAIALREMERET